jgi:hypothetical protein
MWILSTRKGATAARRFPQKRRTSSGKTGRYQAWVRVSTVKSEKFCGRKFLTYQSGQLVAALAFFQPAHEGVIRVPLYRSSTNQFSDEILAIKPALASALVDADCLNLVLHFVTCKNLPSSTVLSSGELQNARVIAFFPPSICFLAHVADVSRDYVCTLKESRRSWRQTVPSAERSMSFSN